MCGISDALALTPAEQAEAERLEREANALEVLNNQGYPGSAALVELDTLVQSAVESDQQAVQNTLDSVQDDIDAVLAGTEPASMLVSIDADLELARQTYANMGSTLWPYLYPVNGAVMLPRYAITREALLQATWLQASSGPIDEGAQDGPGNSLTQLELMAILANPNTMAVAELHTVTSPIILRDFVVINGTQAQVAAGVVTVDDMWLAVGAEVQIENVEVLSNLILYDSTLNTDFSPLLLAHNRDQRRAAFTDMQLALGVPIDPFDVPHPTCSLCGCCVEMCLGTQFSPVPFAAFTTAFAKCPTDFTIIPGPTTGGGVVMEPFYELGGPGWQMDLLGLTLSPDFEDGLEPFFDPEGCGTGGYPDFGGGGQGCNFMCTSCGDPLVWEPSEDDWMGGDDPTTCDIEAVAHLVEDPLCTLDQQCTPQDSAFGALNARWDGTLTPFDKAPFLPISCLQSLHAPGGLPASCELESRSATSHWKQTQCPAGHPTCAPPSGVFQGFTFCPDLTDDSCFSCDAEGHCAQVGEIVGASALVTVTGEYRPNPTTPAVLSDQARMYPEGYSLALQGGKYAWSPGRLGMQASGRTNPSAPKRETDEEKKKRLEAEKTRQEERETRAKADAKTKADAKRAKAAMLAGASNGSPGKGKGKGKGKSTGGSVAVAPVESPNPDRGDSQDGQAAGADDFDPILLQSGELVRTERDLDAAPSQYERDLLRTYRADLPLTSTMGRGWEHNFEESLAVIDGEYSGAMVPAWCTLMIPEVLCIEHKGGDGSRELYMLDPTRPINTFIPESGSRGVLRLLHKATAQADVLETVYVLRHSDGTVTEFRADGQARFKTSSDGVRWTYTYNTDAQLVDVLDPRGHGYRFEYGAFGLLIAVEDSVFPGAAGRRVEYCYDLGVIPYSLPEADMSDYISNVLEPSAAEGGWGLGSAPGCYRYTRGIPDYEYLMKVAGCGKHPAGFAQCLTAAVAGLETDHFAPAPLHEGHTSDAVLRSVARLSEVRTLPNGYDSGDVFIDPEMTGDVAYPGNSLVERFYYSEVWQQPAFMGSLVGSEALDFPHNSPGVGPCGGCLDSDACFALLLQHELENVYAKLVRVERRINDNELDESGQPAVRSGGHYCGGEGTGGWLIELENRYGWDPDKTNYRHVVEQRWTSDVDPAVASACVTGPPAEEPLTDGFASTLPLFGLSYYEPDEFSMIESSVYAEMQAAMAAPTLSNIQLAFAQSNETCQKLGFDYPVTVHDLIGAHNTAIFDDLAAVRTTLRNVNNVVCAINRRVFPGGRLQWTATNVRGQPLLAIVVSDSQAGGLLTTMTLYNHEGNAVEEQFEPDKQGLQFTWAYDDQSTNPLSRGNVLLATQHTTIGGASGHSMFPAGVLNVGRDIATGYTYEPLSNGLLTETVIDTLTQGDVRETRFYYEYLESQQGIDAARDHLKIFGLVHGAADPLAGFSATGDKNGDGDGYHRPLIVAVESPQHQSEAGPATRTTTYTYGGFGEQIASVSAGGSTTAWEYTPLYDTGSLPPGYPLGFVEAVPPFAHPPRDGISTGGVVDKVTISKDYGATASEFGYGTSTFTETVDYIRAGPHGRISHIIRPGNHWLTLEYDPHRRLYRVTTPDDVTMEIDHDGAEQATQLTLIDTTTQQRLRRIRQFFGPAGTLHGTCVEITADACDQDLVSLWFDRAQGSTNAHLTTVRYTPDGRLDEVIDPELGGTRYEYLLWGTVLKKTHRFDAATGLAMLSSEYQYDTLGRPTRIDVAAVGNSELLQTKLGYDDLGRMIAHGTPAGTKSIQLIDPVDGHVFGHASYDANDVLQSQVTVARDAAGLAQSATVHYLSNPSTSTYRDLTTTVKRDAVGRVTCVGAPSGLQTTAQYATDSSVRAMQWANVPGAPCTGSTGTSLEEVWSLSDVTTGSSWRKQRNPATGASSERLLSLNWANRPISLSQSHSLGTNSETSATTVVYDNLGQVTSIEDVRGTATFFGYDQAGRLTDTWHNLSLGGSTQGTVHTQRTYDRVGRLLSVTDPEGHTTTNTYDAIGRIEQEILPNGKGGTVTNKTFYDVLGRVDYTIRGADTWDYSYEYGTSLVGQVQTPTGYRNYTHDSMARVDEAIRTEPGYSVTTQLSYDGLDRMLSEQTAIDSGVWRYTDYDYADQAGRLTNVLVSHASTAVDGVRHGFTYDGAQLEQVDGFVVHRSTAVETNLYRYAISHDGFVPVERAVFYDPNGLGASPPVWFGRDVELDMAGRAGSLEYFFGWDTQNPFLEEQQHYYPDHRIAGSLREWNNIGGSAQVRVAEYDGLGRLAGLRQDTSESSVTTTDWRNDFADPAFWSGLNTTNNVETHTSVLSNANWSGYTRSDLGVLLDEDIPGYDWQASQHAGGTALSSVTWPGESAKTVSWDDRGRMTGLASTNYSWTGDDQIESVTTGSDTESMIYDAFGRVVQVTRFGLELNRIYAGWTTMVEFSDCAQRNWWQGQGLDQPAAYTVLWDSTCTAQTLGAPAFANALQLMDMASAGYQMAGTALTTYPGAVYGIVQDLHNDVIGLVDDQGALREFYDYDVYGSRTQITQAKGSIQCISSPLAACPSEHGNSLCSFAERSGRSPRSCKGTDESTSTA